MPKPLSRQGGSRQSSYPGLIPTVRDVVVPTIVVGLVANKLWNDLGFDLTFSPRRVIHSKSSLIDVVVAPWMFPTSILEIVSRLIQVGVLCVLPYPASIAHMWGFWVTIAIIRVPVAFIFTRSVGWAFPPLFSHYSLYETSAGFGPSVLGLIALDPNLIASLVPKEYATYAVYVTPALAAAFAWLESRAWTYGITIALTFVLAFVTRIPLVYKYLTWLYPCSGVCGDQQKYDDDEKVIDIAPSLRSSKIPQELRRPAFIPILASLAVIIPFFYIPPTRLPFPKSSSLTPILNVLFLSFPRPQGVEISEQLLTTTLDSYTPHLSKDLTLSVFTHSDSHTALDRVQKLYPKINFFTDRDSHPEDVDGHYLHLAEAFRWAEESPAEWTMLVEDDFPICPGGWEVISTAMNMLESDRQKGIIRSAFIGTGGSGIIIHSSYLDLLQVTLRTYSLADSPIPMGVHRRAPDEVVQDCILGRPNSVCERRVGKSIISSRLVLDHIGGMATTTKGKSLNQDKWRCGWRHAFHGDDAVEVIVV